LNYYFLTGYSFALIFFSVSTFNKVVVHERGNIFRNPKFLICLGIIIFYTFFILVNVTSLSVFKQNVSKSFRANLQQINVYTNLLVNLLYAVATLWIPRKQNFTTPFSS
jgi:amino acid permease